MVERLKNHASAKRDNLLEPMNDVNAQTCVGHWDTLIGLINESSPIEMIRITFVD